MSSGSTFRYSVVTSVTLLSLILSIVFPTVTSHLTGHAKEDIRKECKEEIKERADCKKLKHADTRQQCMNDCICEKLGLLTKDGEMSHSVPDMLQEIDQEKYQILRMKCSKAVSHAEYCEKHEILKDCMGNDYKI